MSRRIYFHMLLSCCLFVDAAEIFYTSFGNVQSDLSDPAPVWVLNLPNLTLFHSLTSPATPSFVLSYSNILSDGTVVTCSYNIPSSTGNCPSSNPSLCPECKFDAAQNNISASFIVNNLISTKNLSTIAYSIPASSIINKVLVSLTLKECDNTTSTNPVSASQTCDYECSAELNCGGITKTASCLANAEWSSEPECPTESTTVETTSVSTYTESTVSAKSPSSLEPTVNPDLTTSPDVNAGDTSTGGGEGDGLSDGEIAGIVIGVLVGVGLIAGGIIVYIKKTDYTKGSPSN